MADDIEVGTVFPTSGIDVTCEFGRQPAGTTADGENVRSQDPIAGRTRGGARPGLVKYIPETVNGDFRVQHLAVLVDPQQPSLSRDENPNYPDPSTNNLKTRVPPGRLVRTGGSAIWPKGNDGGGPPPGGGFALVRKAADGNADGSDRTFDLSMASALNQLVVVLVVTHSFDNDATATVAGISGTAFTQVGTTQRFEEPELPGNYEGFSLWYCLSATGESGVRITLTGTDATDLTATVYGYVYSGNRTTGVLDDFVTTTELLADSDTTTSTPAIDVTAAGDLIFYAIGGNRFARTGDTPFSGLTTVDVYPIVSVCHDLSDSGPTATPGFTFTPDPGIDATYGIGVVSASFKKA